MRTTLASAIEAEPPPANISARAPAIRSSGWKIISIGRKMTMDNRLKKSCTVAAPNERLNAGPSRRLPRLTIVLVMVVPMFAPMIMGMAMPTGRPPATSPTITDETVLDDWTSAVARVPRMTPRMGLVAKAKIRSAPSAPPDAALKPRPMTSTATTST